MKAENKSNSSIQKHLEALQAEDPEVVVKTLKEIQEKGNVAYINPLVDLGKKRSEKEIQNALQQILFSLKISAAHPLILEAVSKMGAHPFRKVLLSTIWEAKINAFNHLDTLTGIALEGDLYESIEVFTIFEEMEGEINEEKVLESLLLIKEFESKNSTIDPAKDAFIQSIKDKLELWNKGMQ